MVLKKIKDRPTFKSVSGLIGTLIKSNSLFLNKNGTWQVRWS